MRTHSDTHIHTRMSLYSCPSPNWPWEPGVCGDEETGWINCLRMSGREVFPPLHCVELCITNVELFNPQPHRLWQYGPERHWYVLDNEFIWTLCQFVTTEWALTTSKSKCSPMFLLSMQKTVEFVDCNTILSQMEVAACHVTNDGIETQYVHIWQYVSSYWHWGQTEWSVGIRYKEKASTSTGCVSVCVSQGSS